MIFRDISLCFTSYNLLTTKAVTRLLAALAGSRCSNLSIAACFASEQRIEIPIPSCVPMTWNVTDLSLNIDLNYASFQSLLIGTLQCLEKLVLLSLLESSVPFPSEVWTSLLDTTVFPRLCSFKVSQDIPLPFLLDFLSRHPRISTIIIDTETKVEAATADITTSVVLESVAVISGPPSYVLALLHSASYPLSLTRLSLPAHHVPDSSAPIILQCLAACHCIEALEVLISQCNLPMISSPSDNCTLPDVTSLGIKTFRIMSFETSDFSSGTGDSKMMKDEDVMVGE